MKRADQLFFWATLGALGHAAGHALIANALRLGIYPEGHVRGLDDLLNDPSWLRACAKILPAYPLFWMPLVQTYMANTARNRVALVALVVMVGSLLIPIKYGFAYTQAVLFVGLSVDQLLLPAKEKGFEYALWPVLTVIPSGILSWVEATGCTTHPIMRHWGGHVAYDVVMGSSYLAFYLVCWVRYQMSKKNVWVAGKVKSV